MPEYSSSRRPEGENRQNQAAVYRQEAISPIRCPAAASSTVRGAPCSVRMSAMRNTAPMRMVCSAIWEEAGTRVRRMP